MPVVFLDRLPLPSLQAYTSISVLLLSFSIYYSLLVTSEPEWEIYKGDVDASQLFQSNITLGQKLHIILMSNSVLKRMYEIIYYMIQEPLCIWTLINMAYCCLILLGKLIQKLVFGELRVAEQQHIKDKFWNFVFYKFIFIFGVMNVQYMDEVLLWCSWFSILGFLNLLIQLCKDRYEYLSFSPTTPTLTHVKLFALLFSIFSTAAGSFAICVCIGLQAGLNTFCFMAAECALVTLRTMHVICRYIIHLWDAHHEGVWERRVTCSYYSDLIFDLAILSVDFLHHVHMLLWGNILLSMASLVICMQLRYLLNELQRRVKRHKNYLQVAKHMELNYPVATQEEIESNSDDCAICWDQMESARKLPCGHLFHKSCLRSWLEQVSTCPTCRMSLIPREGSARTSTPDVNRNNILGQENIPPQTPNQTTNHFFHFDGSRYVSWFPSFSVEVSHTSLLGLRQPLPVQTSQLENMAYQVHQMFPTMPIGVIIDDLRITRSVELTVENILDGRLVPPPSSMFQTLRRGSSQSFSATNQETEIPNSSSSSGSQPNNQNNSVESLPGPSTSGTASNASVFDSEHASISRCESIDNSVTRRGGEGCRFSKSSCEREQMLTQRKDELLKRARSKYISRILTSGNSDQQNSTRDRSSSSDSF